MTVKTSFRNTLQCAYCGKKYKTIKKRFFDHFEKKHPGKKILVDKL